MIYYPPLSEIQLEEQFAKLRKLTYNKFFWWRMFDNPNKPLPIQSPLLDRIKNGDYAYSHFGYQAMWVEHEINKLYVIVGSKDMGRFVEESSLLRTRRKRLLEDFHKDEKDKLEAITRDLSIAFRISKGEVTSYMEEFGGTLEELYIMLEQKYPFNKFYLPKSLKHLQSRYD
jgi:hypothetical protein